MKKISLIACVFLMWAGPAVADVVVDWNVIAAQTLVTGAATRPGPSGIFDYAMVHAAIHDAIQAFEGRFEPYCSATPNASGSPVAAAATAAYEVLADQFPAQAGAPRR